MRKEIPRDISFDGLFGPQREYAYFEHAATVGPPPIDRFSWVTAWWLADLSLLAYLDDNDVRRVALGPAGCTSVESVHAGGTHAIVVTRGDFTAVAFRGTEGLDLVDWKTNVRVALTRSGTTGRIHSGFLEAYRQISPGLDDALRGKPAALFCGHSLGGALATLAAAERPAHAVYTFGAPRVGTGGFRDAYPVPAYRIVNNSDLVTQLPPYPYRHTGERIVFDEVGNAVRAPAPGAQFVAALRGLRDGLDDAIQAWRSGDWRALMLRSLVDHGPRRYAVLCWNALVDSRG